MRNAATFDDDFGYDASARKGSPRKPRGVPAPAKKKKGKRRRFDMHRVARYGAIGMAATMAVGIMVNALMLQKGHHPAPLFGKATPAAAAAATLKPAPLPAPRAAATVDVVPAALPVRAARAADPQEAETFRGGDAIGRLLAGGTPSGSAKSEEKTVAGVQRALTKLGFKVPATGSVGAATRKAIEAFEKSRHMVAKGEINRRLVKVLAAESGVKID